MRLLSYWWATLLAVRNSFKPPDQFFDSCSEYCTMDCPSTLTTSQQNWDSLNSQCSESLPRQKFLPFKKNTQLRRPWDMFWLRTPLSQSFPSSSCVSASVGFALQQTTGAWSLQYKESRRFLSTMDSLSVNRLIWFYFCFRICRWIPIKYCCRVLGGYDSPSSLRASVLNWQSVIVRQQYVHRHFVAWKVQVSGMLPALEKLHTLLRVSRGVLGHEVTTLVLKVIIFEIKVEPLAGQWMPSLLLLDGERLEAFAMIIGTKPGWNVCLTTQCPCILVGDYFSISDLLHTLNSVLHTLLHLPLGTCALGPLAVNAICYWEHVVTITYVTALLWVFLLLHWHDGHKQVLCGTLDRLTYSRFYHFTVHILLSHQIVLPPLSSVQVHHDSSSSNCNVCSVPICTGDRVNHFPKNSQGMHYL